MAQPSIRRVILFLLVSSILLAAPHRSAGQHFKNCLSTTTNATILVPGTVSTHLGADHDTLTAGDELAVFTPDGTCAGVGRWDGANLAIATAGTNPIENEGFEPGEPFQLRIWDASSDTTYYVEPEYEACDETNPLCRDDGRYEPDALYALASFSSASQPPSDEDRPNTECQPVSMAQSKVSVPSGEPGQVTVTFTHPDGVTDIHFTDEHDRPALQNLTVGAPSEAFTSTDNIRWTHTAGADAPSSVTLSLTRSDPGAATAQFQAAARSICASDGDMTHFTPSPTYTFKVLPLTLTASGNAPNPFRHRTTFHFKTSTAAPVTITVYNILGQRIATLVDRELPAGSHAVDWDGRTRYSKALSSGVYLYRIQAGNQTQTGRMTIVR